MLKIRWILFAAFVLTSCRHESTEEVADIEVENEITVSAIEASTKQFSHSLHLVGEVKAAEHVALFSKVQGKLASYLVQKGEQIEKGEVVASIDRDEVGYTFKQAPVTSPLSGVIASLDLDEGSEVQHQPIGYVMNIDDVKVVFDLPERYRSTVFVGQDIEIQIEAIHHPVFYAQVTAIDPLINPHTHTFTIEANIENKTHTLLPGMFATAELILERFEKSILLPEEAITAIRGEWFIYKMEEAHAVLQKIELGMRKEGMVQILEGVNPGDKIIVGGNHKVSNGQKVKSATL